MKVKDLTGVVIITLRKDFAVIPAETGSYVTHHNFQTTQTNYDQNSKSQKHVLWNTSSNTAFEVSLKRILSVNAFYSL